MSFSGKVVLVTGASSGIGAATAVLLAGAGARVALVARNETKLAHVASQCAKHGNQPLIIKADVANDEETKTIVKKTVDHFGQLDVLVNNAGVVRFASITDPDILQMFDFIINTNLRSAVHLTSLAVPHLAATKGNIVNVSSVGAHYVVAENLMSYAVSKAGMDHFTRCTALELAAFGVRVNSVNPGPVKTDMAETANFNFTEDIYVNGFAKTALGRMGEPEEIADLIAFLASDKAKSITGSTFVSDNGMSLRP